MRLAFALLLTLTATSVPVAAGKESDTMADLPSRCVGEVQALHRFFVDWFTAGLPDDDAAFARFERALGEDFEIIGPNGQRTGRGDLVRGLRAAHGGRADGDFAIAIENPRARTVGDGLCLVTYEEHQTMGGTVRAWQSSALLDADDEAPGGFVWRHVHETYLPGYGPGG